MTIKDRVLNQAANWLVLAEKGQISYETASLLVNAFELGMAEFAEETSQSIVHQQAYDQVQDVNQYLKNIGQTVVHPSFSTDLESSNRIASEIRSTVNFKSRALHKKAKLLATEE